MPHSLPPEATGWRSTLEINHCFMRLNTRHPPPPPSHPLSLLPSSPHRGLSVPFFALVINMKRSVRAEQLRH